MPKTLERVALPQPHSSCWQPLGCLSPLCWTGIAGSNTTGTAVTDRRCCRRGTNWGKQEQQTTAHRAAQEREGTWEVTWTPADGERARQEGWTREKGHACVNVWPWAAAQGRVIESAFCHRRKWCDYSFWIKKWELLWCLQAWETYLHALPSGTLPPFPSWVLSHFSYHGSVLTRKPSDGPLISFFIPSWTTFCPSLGKTLSRSLWQWQQLLKSSPEDPSSNPVVSVKTWCLHCRDKYKSTETNKIIPSSRTRL